MTAPGNFSSGDVLTAADMNALPAGIIDVDTMTGTYTVPAGFPGSTYLSVTGTFDTNRRYRVMLNNVFVYNNTVANIAIADLFRDTVTSSNRVQFASVEAPSAAFDGAIQLAYLVNGGLSGSHTFNLSFRTTTGTTQFYASGSIPVQLTLEDLGRV